MRQRRVVLVFGIPIVAFIVLVSVHKAVTHTDPPKPARIVRPSSYSVGEVNCTFTDTSRPTPTYNEAGQTGEKPGRVLVTEIRYPTVHPVKGDAQTPGAAPARVDGPFPLIVFAHGYDLTPDTYAALLDTWVRAGFVVAAPIFPDTNETYVTSLGDVGGPEGDDVNQPGDVAFVAKSVLSDSRTTTAACRSVHHLVSETDGVGLAGQSDGATTVGMLANDLSYRSNLTGLSVRAVAILSGSPWGAQTYGAPPGNPPELVVQSATDQCNVASESIALYDHIGAGPKAFLEILDATHLGPYTGSAPAPFALVAKLSTAWFEHGLLRTVSQARVTAIGNSAPTVGTLTVNGVAPAIAPLAQDDATCYDN
jgi:dienelactone hydrolase